MPHLRLLPHGRSNLCRNMRFFGSAAIYPHVQGAFSETFIARADQCVKVPDSMSMRVAACAEPLAVFRPRLPGAAARSQGARS